MAASRAQGLRMRLSTLGPLFSVTATRVGGDGDVELGRAEGAVRPWPGGSVLHLDSMRMSRATLEVPDRPLFGLGIFLGAVTVRHGFDAGCVRAELLAIDDTPLYHNKVSPLRHRQSISTIIMLWLLLNRIYQRLVNCKSEHICAVMIFENIQCKH